MYRFVNVFSFSVSFCFFFDRSYIAYNPPTSMHRVRINTPSPARHVSFCLVSSCPIFHVMLNRKPSRLFTRRLNMEAKYSRGVILTDSGIEIVCCKHIFGTTAAMDGVD